MLDLSKKYWTDFGPLMVRCSIESANVVVNLQQRQLFVDDNSPIPGIETYPISDKAKEIFLKQKAEGHLLPTAFPDKPETIEALKELEALGYIVFYDVDEPIGHSLSDDRLEEDTPPETTLEELRTKVWNSIADSHVRAGATTRPEMPEYPKKEYGRDWFVYQEQVERKELIEDKFPTGAKVTPLKDFYGRDYDCPLGTILIVKECVRKENRTFIICTLDDKEIEINSIELTLAQEEFDREEAYDFAHLLYSRHDGGAVASFLMAKYHNITKEKAQEIQDDCLPL